MFQLIHLKAGDLHFLIRGKQPTSNTVILAVDQKSIDTYKELMYFWHPYYADAIKAAAEGGAKVMMIDIAFGVDVEKYEPGHDGLLVEAVDATLDKMPVICANLAALNKNERIWPVPINILASAFNLNAYPNLTSGPDDFIRTQELVE